MAEIEREKINLWMTKKRLVELKILSRELDIPVSILIREGVQMLIKKYKPVLLEAMRNEPT
ncbi:MAG: ribbon-helix-helix domain-containing protein [Candidatus Neomarinimicrobiota bacterium]